MFFRGVETTNQISICGELGTLVCVQEVQVNPVVNNHVPPPCSNVALNVCKTVLEDLEHVLHWSQFEAAFPFCSGLLRYLTWNRLMVHWYFAIHVEIYHSTFSTSSGKKMAI